MPNTAEPQSNTNSESNETEQTDQVENPSLTDGNRTRSGRVSKPPETYVSKTFKKHCMNLGRYSGMYCELLLCFSMICAHVCYVLLCNSYVICA